MESRRGVGQRDELVGLRTQWTGRADAGAMVQESHALVTEKPSSPSVSSRGSRGSFLPPLMVDGECSGRLISQSESVLSWGWKPQAEVSILPSCSALLNVLGNWFTEGSGCPL